MLAVILLQVIVLFLKSLKDKQKGTVGFQLLRGIFLWDRFHENHHHDRGQYAHHACKEYRLRRVIHQVKIGLRFRQSHFSRVDRQLNDVGEIIWRNQAMG